MVRRPALPLQGQPSSAAGAPGWQTGDADRTDSVAVRAPADVPLPDADGVEPFVPPTPADGPGRAEPVPYPPLPTADGAAAAYAAALAFEEALVHDAVLAAAPWGAGDELRVGATNLRVDTDRTGVRPLADGAVVRTAYHGTLGYDLATAATTVGAASRVPSLPFVVRADYRVTDGGVVRVDRSPSDLPCALPDGPVAIRRPADGDCRP
jgi:hypothetical protein